MKIGDVVKLPETEDCPEQKGEVLEIAANGTITVSIFDEYREDDDEDGLVEITADQIEVVDADELADWE